MYFEISMRSISNLVAADWNQGGGRDDMTSPPSQRHWTAATTPSDSRLAHWKPTLAAHSIPLEQNTQQILNLPHSDILRGSQLFRAQTLSKQEQCARTGKTSPSSCCDTRSSYNMRRILRENSTPTSGSKQVQRIKAYAASEPCWSGISLCHKCVSENIPTVVVRQLCQKLGFDALNERRSIAVKQPLLQILLQCYLE